MAKIGPIFSIILPAASTEVQPAVLNGVPLSDPFLFLYKNPVELTNEHKVINENSID